MLEPLVSGEAAVVFGTRAWTSQSSFSFWYVMGNKSVTFATNVLYNCWISDVMTCYKAMHTELFRSLPLKERGFAIEPEIAARVLRAGERIHEVPISYRARSREAGKKLTRSTGCACSARSSAAASSRSGLPSPELRAQAPPELQLLDAHVIAEAEGAALRLLAHVARPRLGPDEHPQRVRGRDVDRARTVVLGRGMSGPGNDDDRVGLGLPPEHRVDRAPPVLPASCPRPSSTTARGRCP